MIDKGCQTGILVFQPVPLMEDDIGCRTVRLNPLPLMFENNPWKLVSLKPVPLIPNDIG